MKFFGPHSQQCFEKKSVSILLKATLPNWESGKSAGGS